MVSYHKLIADCRQEFIPPDARPALVDWRALSETDRKHVVEHRGHLRTLSACSQAAKTYLDRHKYGQEPVQ